MNINSAKKFMAAAMLGAFAISIPVTADARIHDPKVQTRSIQRGGSVNGNTFAMLLDGLSEIPRHVELYDDFDAPQPFDDFGRQATFQVPQTVSASDPSIIGTPMATQQQCVKYLLRNNPHPNLNVSPEEIVAYYYEEGSREGIRPDVAFAQALRARHDRRRRQRRILLDAPTRRARAHSALIGLFVHAQTDNARRRPALQPRPSILRLADARQLARS